MSEQRGEAGGSGRTTALRSLALSFANRYCVMLLRLLVFFVLARLLTPRDYGIFASSAVCTELCGTLVEMGMPQFLIRERDLTLAMRRAALGLSLAAAALAAAVVLVVCLLLPGSWLDPILRKTLAVLSLTFALQPFSVTSCAILQREMRFGVLYWIGLTEAMVLACVAIPLAASGFGPLSLAWAIVAQVLAGTTMACAARPPVWPSFLGWRAAFRFGRSWIAILGMMRAGHALSLLTVSGLIGFGAVGLLSRAQKILQLFDRALIDALRPVVLPAVAARQRAGGDLETSYLRQVAYISAVAWPFFGVVALVLAEPLVRILLGPEWMAAVPTVRILAITGLFLPIGALVLPYLVALGIIGRWVPRELGLQAVQLVLVFAACTVSLEFACVAFVMGVLLRTIVVERLLHAELGYHRRDLARALGISLVPCVACLIGAGLSVFMLDGRSGTSWLLLMAAVGGGGALWTAAVFAVRHPLSDDLVWILQKVSSAVVGDARRRWR